MHRDGLRVVEQSQPGRAGGDAAHRDKCETLRQQMVEHRGGVDRQIQQRQAQADDSLREDGLAPAPQAVAREQRNDRGRDAERDASSGSEPIVIDAVFEQEGRAEQEREDGDAVDPVEPERRFEGNWLGRRGVRRAALIAARSVAGGAGGSNLGSGGGSGARQIAWRFQRAHPLLQFTLAAKQLRQVLGKGFQPSSRLRGCRHCLHYR